MYYGSRTDCTVWLTGLLCAAALLLNAPAFGDPIFGEPIFYGTTHDFATVAGDFNNDGDIDIFSASPPERDGFGQLISHGSYAIYDNQSGSGTFAATVLDTEHGGSALAAADLNGDGNLDVVSCNIIEGMGNSTNVLLGNGDGTFAPAVSYGDINTDARAVALGDMDNDMDVDIVLPNGSRVLLNDGDGTFYTNYVGSDVAAGGTIALGDLNEDDHLDIVTARDFYHPNDDFVSVQLGTGNGNGDPGPPFQLPIGGYSPWRVRLADLNDDGHLDLVTINQASQDMSFLLGHGDGTFDSPVTLPVSDASNISPNVITIDDYDGDGLSDAAVTSTVYGDASSHQETSILLFNQSTGSFDLVQTIVQFGQYLENITAADLDADGDTDLATATHLLLNLTDPLSPGDLNCDGAVNSYDIDGFICALSAQCDYEGMYPDCDRQLADCNADGEVNAYDIDDFIVLVGG